MTTEDVWVIARRLYSERWRQNMVPWAQLSTATQRSWFEHAARLVLVDISPPPRRALIIDNAAQAAHYASECVGYEMRWTGTQSAIVNAVFASGYKMEVRSFVPQGETREDQRADADRVFREYVERLAAGEQVVDG